MTIVHIAKGYFNLTVCHLKQRKELDNYHKRPKKKMVEFQTVRMVWLQKKERTD
jgi:hypothetical protein